MYLISRMERRATKGDTMPTDIETELTEWIEASIDSNGCLSLSEAASIIDWLAGYVANPVQILRARINEVA